MATAEQLRQAALALDGTIEAPHFDRTAFKVSRIYATLAPDGLTANLKLSVDEQEFKCLLAPRAFAAVPNAWGRQVMDDGEVAELSQPELTNALETAWRHALPRRKALSRKT